MSTHCQSNKRRILFQGTPAVKMVKHYSHLDVEAKVTPIMVIQEGKDIWGDNELHWGLVLQCVPQSLLFERAEGREGEDLVKALELFEIDNTFSGWSNPVRWWRALQFLEAMPVLNHRNLGLGLWRSTGRPDAENTFELKRIEGLRSTFAEGYCYEEIMARPVPMDILQLTIQLLDEGQDMEGVQDDLTDEVEAGSIRWSQELKRVGVSHPDYRRGVQVALAEVIKRYRDHLFSYAAFLGCPYEDNHREKGFIMVCIERAIYEAIERGIEQNYGMDITAMISILHEEIQSDDIMEKLEKEHPHDYADCEPYVRPAPEQRFSNVLTWATQHFPLVGMFSRKDELNQKLHHLLEQWDTLPIVQPLVS